MIRRRALAAALAIGALLTGFAAALAKDMGSLYDDATLERWQASYRRGVLRNFEEVILSRLTAEERRRLADVQFDFPLRGYGNDPFAFYATHPPPTVTLPVLSLNFFDDLTVALAWLSRNGYGIETPFEYVAMLKYRDEADLGGRYPSPLPSLGIPDDALDSQDVVDLSSKIFDSAIAFVMLHELGHIAERHAGYDAGFSPEQVRANEAAADRFALEIMRRLASQPTGMLFLFQALAHGTPLPADYSSAAAYEAALASATHPLTADRVHAIAKSLRESAEDFARNEPDPVAGRALVESVAQQIAQVADLLADTDVQNAMAKIGRSTQLDMLAPRRPGELAAPTEPVAVPADAPAFHGTYAGEIGVPDGSVPIRTIVRRQGTRVTGEYYYGLGSGRLTGIVEGESLVFEWREGTSRGYGIFRETEGGHSFTGTWGFGESSEDGGSWTGQRAEQ